MPRFIKAQNATNFTLLSLTIFIFIWSLINPRDYFIWFLETLPIFIGGFLIFLNRKNFALSDFLYQIILVHMIILAIGGHYTYAEVPFFNYIKHIFNLSRNEYDKIGHFFQGITPTLLIREIIFRKTDLKNKKLVFIFSVSSALAFSALYEIFEWLMSILSSSGQDFVGMQGDIWDAQKDMLTAFIGAVFAMIFLKNIHNKSLNKFIK